jgi:hypothetical protein
LSALERRRIKREAEHPALALPHLFPLLSIEEKIKGEESIPLADANQFKYPHVNPLQA